MILDRDQFFEAIQNRIGEDSSDEAIEFIENMTDTYNDMEAKGQRDGVDWEERYKELDEKWKKKYAHRFFSGGSYTMPLKEETDEEGEEDKAAKITYKDLFKEG